MSAPRFARLASSLLGRRAVGPPPPPTPAARAEAIAAIGQALAARARRRRALRWAVSLAACAAVFIGAFVVARRVALRPAGTTEPPVAAAARVRELADVRIVAHPVGDGASLVVSGARAPLPEGSALSAGSRIVTPAGGRAKLAFSTGTDVAVDEATDMTVGGEGAAQVLRLDTGSIDLHVAKLSPGSRFFVRTVDAEVEVRGTQFRVSIAPPDPACGTDSRTRVTVAEGVVVVRHAGVEARVPAGASWPLGCASAPSVLASPAPVARTAAPVAVSGLADQNNLFASALSARRSGDLSAALAGFDRFIAKYPAAPLSENAHVERMRLLRALASARAPASAREYLSLYPGGFARSEAEAIAAGTP